MEQHRPTRESTNTLLKNRLGQLLVETGVIDQAQLQAALSYQRSTGCRLGQVLVRLNLASEAQVVQALSRRLKCARVDLAALQAGPALVTALKLVPPELALREKILPVGASENSLTLAMADPSNFALVSELSLRTGRRVDAVIAGEGEIVAAVRRFYASFFTSSPLVTLNRETTDSYPISSEHDAPRSPPRQRGLQPRR